MPDATGVFFFLLHCINCGIGEVNSVAGTNRVKFPEGLRRHCVLRPGV